MAERLSAVVFYSVPVRGAMLPLIVLWLVAAGFFFTIYFRFINVFGVAESLRILRSQRTRDREKGEISAFQALSAALSGTVGLGAIAGVAVAISVGGPGAAFWMTVAGFLGMATKFVECTLAVAYRQVHADGTVSGGPMYYLSAGLARRGLPGLGRALALVTAIAFPFASLCIFQVNQGQAQFAEVTGIRAPLFFGMATAVLVGVVILGGIRKIAKVAATLVPLKCGIYVLSCTFILIVHADRIPAALELIGREAFTGHGVAGGALGALIAGVRRAVYSNEAGLGSSAIAHAAVRTNEPLTEGFVGLLEPLIDSLIICTLTALIIVVTGVYADRSAEGVVLTSRAFATVAPWFPVILMLCVLVFAYSTIISWFYYGLKAFTYLAGDGPKRVLGYKFAYCLNLMCAAVIPLNQMIDLVDSMNFILAIPNIIGLYILAPEVKQRLHHYRFAARASGVSGRA